MARYILLLTLTPEGREKMLADPDKLLREESTIRIRETQTLGIYALLGDYDFACILEAPDNEAAARYSLELGVKAGVLITTMPVIPIGSFEDAAREKQPAAEPAGTDVASD